MSRELVGHKCGACKLLVYPAIFEKTGLRMHLEASNRGDLVILPELPGLRGNALPHAAKVGRGGAFKEHKHDAFSAVGFSGKRRTA